MEKKKSSIGYIIVIILLILGFGGYILFDQGIIKLDMFDKKEEVKGEVVEKEELDVNSRLVQNLYNMVTSNVDDSSRYWIYRQNGLDLSDFFADKDSEEIKMNIVGLNLSESKKIIGWCENVSVPAQKDHFYSSCEKKISGGEKSVVTHYYSRSYVENLYKTIFGKDAKLDTSVSIAVDWARSTIYSYVEEYDGYFEYYNDVGGTVGLDYYDFHIDRAHRESNQLKVYESVKINSEYLSEEVKDEEFYYVYTFELEDDGMYKFVSRVKEDK